MLIGTSLGRCLISILRGEVREEDVILITTATDCPTYQQYIGVVKSYHKHGNPHSRSSGGYDFGDIPLEDALDLAERLWNSGRIHQPRTFGATGLLGSASTIWLDIVPVPDGSNEYVMEAWDKYRTLALLAG